MKKIYTEEQIVYALREVESGVKVKDLCREMGISEQTYYTWRKKYGSAGISEVRELKSLRDENQRLIRLVADLSLDKHMLQEVLQKKL